MPNRLVVFVKTKASWHALSPVRCPEGMTRRSFNFNLVVPFDRRQTFGHRAFESYHRRTEAWRFRDHAELNRKPE